MAPFVPIPTLLASELVVVPRIPAASGVPLRAIAGIGSIAIAMGRQRAVEIPFVRLGRSGAWRVATRFGVERSEKAT